MNHTTEKLNPSLTAQQHKEIAREHHAILQHNTVFYPKANQYRRVSFRDTDNTIIISSALAVRVPCALKTKDFILSTQDKIKNFALKNIHQISELTHHANGRLIRWEGRVAIVEVLTFLLFRTDIATLKVGIPGIDGAWFGLDYAEISRNTKLKKSAVKRAIKKVVDAGIIECHRQIVTFIDNLEGEENTREYRQLANVYVISENFLKKLKMHKYWKAECDIQKRKGLKKQIEQQEKAGERAALQRLGLASASEENEIKLKKVKTTTYHDRDTGKSHTTVHTQQYDDYGNTTSSARADFLKFKKMFGS